MKIVTDTFYGTGGKPSKKSWKTKGIDSIMGIPLPELRHAIAYGDEAFLLEVEAAEKKATEIGEKALAWMKERGHHFILGFSYAYFEVVPSGGYKFWFEVATEPEYSL